MIGRTVRGLRAWLRHRFGLWVVHEARNKAARWPRALAVAVRERREVARLRRTVTAPPARVTTVMPTYRRHDLLRAALASALAQDEPDHTVIVVDDGGGLPADLPDDPRLVAVSLSRNSACLGMVRNVGLRLANSPVVAFLDDDNTWHPDHLTVALRGLEDADLVYTAVERVHPDGTPLDVLSRPFDRATFADSSYVDANSIVLRHGRGVRFSRVPRDKNTLPKEDWEFVWRMSRRRRTVHLPETTVRYTVNPASYYTAWGPASEATTDGIGGAGADRGPDAASAGA